MLMAAGTKSLAIGKPFFRVLLLVASPGLYTACPGWSTLGSSCLCYESEMRNAGTRTHMHIFLLLLHARQAALCSGTAGQTDSDSGAANRLQVGADMGPGAQSPDMLFSFLSFPFFLPASNQPFSLPRIGMGFWMAPHYSSSALSSTISNYLSIMGPRPTGLTFASC